MRLASLTGCIVVVCALAVACGGGPGDQGSPTGSGGTAITNVILQDGVHCGVMDGANAKALSCDWSGPRGRRSNAVPHGDSGTAITTVVLRNGVICAVMDGANAKALSCNWSGRHSKERHVDPSGDGGTVITVVRTGDLTCAVMDSANAKALSCSRSDVTRS
jgi:hypothetical protein